MKSLSWPTQLGKFDGLTLCWPYTKPTFVHISWDNHGINMFRSPKNGGPPVLIQSWMTMTCDLRIPHINGNFRILKWRYVSTICLANFFWGYSLKFRPFLNRPFFYGRYLQSIGSCCMTIDCMILWKILVSWFLLHDHWLYDIIISLSVGMMTWWHSQLNGLKNMFQTTKQ